MRQVILNGLFGAFMGGVIACYIFPHSVPWGMVSLLVYWATILNSLYD